MQKNFKALCFLFWLCGYSSLLAQNGTIDQNNSPYSYYGLGDMHPDGFGLSRGLGGISAPLRGPSHLAISNPASYAAVRLTTFEFGARCNLSWWSQDINRHRSSDLNLASLALGIPILKYKGGISMGLLPYSSMNYNINDSRVSGNGFTENLIYQGLGDLYQAHVGGGYRLGKPERGIAFGANLFYLFGSLDRVVVSQVADEANFFNTRLSLNNKVSGLSWNLGLQGDLKLKTKNPLLLVAGLSWRGNNEINSRRTTIEARQELVFTSSGSFPVWIELNRIEEGNAKLTLPGYLQGGLALYGNNNWLVGLDMRFGQWNKVSVPGQNVSLTDNLRAAAGIAFTPDPRAYTKFFKKMNYRFGLYYDTNYLRLYDTNLPIYGLTLGGAIPVRSGVSNISFTFDFGQRGSLKQNLLRENYAKMSLGINLNDPTWFQKRQFD